MQLLFWIGWTISFLTLKVFFFYPYCLTYPYGF